MCLIASAKRKKMSSHAGIRTPVCTVHLEADFLMKTSDDNPYTTWDVDVERVILWIHKENATQQTEHLPPATLPSSPGQVLVMRNNQILHSSDLRKSTSYSPIKKRPSLNSSTLLKGVIPCYRKAGREVLRLGKGSLPYVLPSTLLPSFLFSSSILRTSYIQKMRI